MIPTTLRACSHVVEMLCVLIILIGTDKDAHLQAGKEFDIMSQKLLNEWSKLEISMSTLVKKMFTEVINMKDNQPFWIDMSSIDTCTAADYSTSGCTMKMDVSNVGFGSAGSNNNVVIGIKQCFSTSLAVPFPSLGMGLMGNAAMTAWPVQACIQNSDCAIGTECATGLGLTNAIIGMDDPLDLLLYGSGSNPGECGSTKSTNNKGIAKVMEYFTGKTQDPAQFAFCMPRFTEPNLEKLITSTSKVKNVDLWRVNGLSSYKGVLPGITDQPSIVVSFPPSDSESYTWPQKTQRRVEWANFNIPADAKVTLKLMKANAVVDTKADLTNDMSELYTMSSDVSIGTGYSFAVCASTGVCSSSGKFSVVAEKTDRMPPVKGGQIFPSGGADLTPGTEAYGVFAGAFKTNLAQVLRIASHRVEIDTISATVSGRRSSITVNYVIHPDDTGKDSTTPQDLLVKAESPSVKMGIVSNQATYAASAQTSNADVASIAESGEGRFGRMVG